MPYRLYIKDSDKLIGTITDEQQEQLVQLLEEEDAEDSDYFIDKDVLEFMEGEGVDPELLTMLRHHVTEDDGIEVEWKPDTKTETKPEAK